MIKKLHVFLIVLLALLVTGCASVGGPAETTQEDQPKQEEAKQEAPVKEEAKEEAAAPSGEKVTLTIESWRNDDLAIWQDVLIPAFNQHYPDIEVVFAPTAPAEYNSVLNTKLEGGTAGDLITCRPFDTSLGLYEAGHLAALNDLTGLENFGDVAKSAWITDDGSDSFLRANGLGHSRLHLQRRCLLPSWGWKSRPPKRNSLSCWMQSKPTAPTIRW